jgi:hypothetical protein
MQKMKNDYKQMGLDKLCKKLTYKKAGGTSTGPMSLEEKKDFIAHQAFVKQVSKDNDLARAYPQKEIKKGLSVKPWLCCQHDAQHIEPKWRHVVKHIGW